MSKYFKYHPSYQEDPLILEAVEAAKSFHGLTDANLYFGTLCDSGSGFTKLISNVYCCKDYYINVGKRFLMAGHARCIMDLSRLELSCLPQGIAVIWLDNGEDMVLVTRIKGSEGHRIVPYSNCMTELSVPAGRRLLADADRLLRENLAVTAFTESKDSWYMIEGEDRIIFSRCETAFVPDNAKPAYRNRVLEALGLRE